MIQHNVLSKYKYMNLFLQAHAWPVYEEVQTLYVDTLSKIYGAYFKAYLAGLAKLESPGESPPPPFLSMRDFFFPPALAATKYDLLGIEPEKQKSWLDRFTTTRTGNIFALGDRGSILEEVGADAIVPHEAAGKNLKVGYESLFRSLNQYLLDSVTSEWLFCIGTVGFCCLFFISRGMCSPS